MGWNSLCLLSRAFLLASPMDCGSNWILTECLEVFLKVPLVSVTNSLSKMLRLVMLLLGEISSFGVFDGLTFDSVAELTLDSLLLVCWVFIVWFKLVWNSVDCDSLVSKCYLLLSIILTCLFGRLGWAALLLCWISRREEACLDLSSMFFFNCIRLACLSV